VLTNSPPVPDVDDELFDEHPLKRSNTGIIKPGRKRNLIPILYPCPLLQFPAFKLS
jgi:hypothetical protein